MTKNERLVETLIELLKEQNEITRAIEKLPSGYLDEKVVSGHLYTFRQWREGKKVKSVYVKDVFVPSMKRKIAIRKSNELLLKTIKKEIKSIKTKIIKNNLLTEEEVFKMESRF